MVSSRTSSQACRACGGFLSSRAIRVSPSKAVLWTRSRWVANLVFAICSRAVSAKLPAEYVSRRNSSMYLLAKSLAAQRFEGTLDDIFELQDQVTASVISALLPSLEKSRDRACKAKPIESLDAYDLYLRAMSLVYRWTKDLHDDALRLFYKVIELEPDFASAYGMAARCYTFRTANGWMTNPAADADEVLRLCRAVMVLGQDDAIALCTAGHALARVVGDTETGVPTGQSRSRAQSQSW